MNEETTIEENSKTELIVEQTDIDKVLSFPIFEQIESIENTNAEILKAIQEQNTYLIPSEEEQAEMQLLEGIEEENVIEEEAINEDEILIEEELTQEEIDAQLTAEELALLEQQTIIENLPLIVQELQSQNVVMQENQVALIEQLEQIEEHGSYTNEVDAMTGTYLMWIVPFLLIILLFSKIINPFLRG